MASRGGVMSSGRVLAFLHRPSRSSDWNSRSSDWNQQELAEFYRVESALLQGGLSVTTDRGVSDEGDPWFVFCRSETEEVIAHFARIGDEYVIISSLHTGVARGRDFRALVRQMIEMHPLMLPLRRSQGQKILLHPAALLTAMLASAYFLTQEKEAAGINSPSESKNTVLSSLLTEKLGYVAAAGLIAVWFEHQAEAAFKFLENGLLGIDPSGDKDAHSVASTHDTPLETAILPDLRDVQLAANRIDLSKSDLPNSQAGDGDNGNNPAEATQASPTPTMVSDAGSVNATNIVVSNDHISNTHSDAIQSDADNAQVAVNLQPAPVREAEVASPPSVEPNMPSSPTQSSASTGLVAATSEAVLQLVTSDATSSLIQPIVLSNGPEDLSAALHQVFAQVGLETQAIHTDTTIDVSSIDSSTLASNAPAVTGSATNPTPVLPAATENQIMRTVETFLQDTPSVEIAVSGHNVVIIDTNAADALSPKFGVLTWELSNGETLSIVGIIPHHHAAATA
jgi:hypothetical protein